MMLNGVSLRFKNKIFKILNQIGDFDKKCEWAKNATLSLAVVNEISAHVIFILQTTQHLNDYIKE